MRARAKFLNIADVSIDVFNWGDYPKPDSIDRLQVNQAQNDTIAVCESGIQATDPLHCNENRSNGDIWASARSQHPGGVNAAMADGSARFFTESTDVSVWRALATRANGGAENLTAIPE